MSSITNDKIILKFNLLTFKVYTLWLKNHQVKKQKKSWLVEKCKPLMVIG